MNTITIDGIDFFPSKIVCIGRNYVDHIKELGNQVPTEPVIFIKPNSSISKDIIFSNSEIIHYESEISFLILGGALRGVAFGLDLTKRDIQSELKAKGLPWERAKAFDNSAVFSPFKSFSGNVKDLSIELYINDVLAQKGNYQLMLNKPATILSEVTSFMSFEDGDIIMTGTPKGVGIINSGDIFSGKIFEKDTLLIESTWEVQEEQPRYIDPVMSV